jgi:hypothetical protein
LVADGAAGATPRGTEKAKTFPPINAEYTEIRRKKFYSVDNFFLAGTGPRCFDCDVGERAFN